MSFSLQEHKLRYDNLVRNNRMLWRRDNFWSLEASPSNEVEDIRIGVGRGGIAMCFHYRLQHVIQDQGFLPGNYWNQ